MKKVVIGMSGGVDSSVAAYLLKEQGYEVIGVTMQMWQENGSDREKKGDRRSGVSAVDDARCVAQKLGIQHYVVNFEEEFKRYVVSYFVGEYAAGRTPNPCIACNRYVKWEALFKHSAKIGADYIATGHYARIAQLRNGRFTVRKSCYAAKDQTYVLYNLTQEQLAHTLMLLGDYSKDEVREIAEGIGLAVAHKPDSQDICFVPDGDYAGFITGSEFGAECSAALLPGNFVDIHGTIIGQHKGYLHYTVGQRKGLGLAAGHPVYVVEIRPKTNEVVIGDDAACYSDGLLADGVNWMAVDDLSGQRHLTAKIRYSHREVGCTVKMQEDDTLECMFDEPQRAVTPGQALVLYDGDMVYGGATIRQCIRK